MTFAGSVFLMQRTLKPKHTKFFICTGAYLYIMCQTHLKKKKQATTQHSDMYNLKVLEVTVSHSCWCGSKAINQQSEDKKHTVRLRYKSVIPNIPRLISWLPATSALSFEITKMYQISNIFIFPKSKDNNIKWIKYQKLLNCHNPSF